MDQGRGRLRSRRSRRLLVLAAFALMAATSLAPSLPAAGAPPPKLYDLDKVPKPKITGAEIISGLEEFVAKFPMRQNGLPNNVAAAEFLAEEATGYGFKTRILELETTTTPSRTVRVVEAIKRGTTKPDEWIAFIAHYDIVPQTVQGAYDDGSGTNMLRFFGKAFSKIKTKRSIALLWFDAEENGLLASRLYADMLEKKGQKIAAGLGFDMVGIGHPAPYCTCIFYGRLEDAGVAVPIIEHVNFDYLGFPEGDGGQTWPLGTEGHICNCGPSQRNSDERNFAAKGYFVLRWAGMKAAAHYPGYHQPWDTVPLMEVVAGGRANLEAGTENTFLSAYYSAFVIDNM